jgi:four helix bundle protein
MRNAECGALTIATVGKVSTLQGHFRCEPAPGASYSPISQREARFPVSLLQSEDYRRWASALNSDITADPLWCVSAYRLGLFAGDMAWDDAGVVWRNGVTRATAGQLYRATWSIPANAAEGYSRSSGRDRARLFEYALGSTREAAVWYRAARRVLSEDLVEARIATLAEIRRLLLVMVPVERNKNRR